MSRACRALKCLCLCSNHRGRRQAPFFFSAFHALHFSALQKTQRNTECRSKMQNSAFSHSNKIFFAQRTCSRLQSRCSLFRGSNRSIYLCGVVMRIRLCFTGKSLKICAVRWFKPVELQSSDILVWSKPETLQLFTATPPGYVFGVHLACSLDSFWRFACNLHSLFTGGHSNTKSPCKNLLLRFCFCEQTSKQFVLSNQTVGLCHSFKSLSLAFCIVFFSVRVRGVL